MLWECYSCLAIRSYSVYRFVLEHIAVAQVDLLFSIFSIFFSLDMEVMVTLLGRCFKGIRAIHELQRPELNPGSHYNLQHSEQF